MAGLKDIAKAAGADPIRCPHCGQHFRIVEVLEMLFLCIMQRVRDGEKVTIRNFGVFSKRIVPSRVLKNPFAGGKEVSFPDRMVMSFRQAAETKRFMNRFKNLKTVKTKEMAKREEEKND